MFFSNNLKKFQNLNHCFFSRKGGNSLGIYKSLNCGIGSKDSEIYIKDNLKLVSSTLKVKEKDLILMKQTHSNKVFFIDKKLENKKRLEADALITNIREMALSVLTADCVPILIYEELNQIIACIHAGWKGAVNGIIENTIKKIFEINRNSKINVAIGPCIGKKSYEVDRDFYDHFSKIHKDNKLFFSNKNDNKFLFDLRKYVNYKINKFDINKVENIELDTYADKDNFFSYRRSVHLNEKDYGRCISSISLSCD
jgi:YfiH family protein